MQRQDQCSPTDGRATALYERYAASIFAYARLHTPSWEDAEDLTLEVFTAALEQESLSWLADKQQFVWLRSVAQHKLVDRYRRSIHVSVIPYGAGGRDSVRRGGTVTRTSRRAT
jgi:DNA-directed RNA polymerase specialized sigma24 family protein